MTIIRMYDQILCDFFSGGLDFTEWGAVDALDETGYSIRLGIWTLPSQVLECSCLGAVTLRVLINGYGSLFVGAATP